MIVKKRVLHILCSRKFSGAENMVCQIGQVFINDDKYEMIYCSPDGPIREAVESRGITFVAMHAKDGRPTVAGVRKTICELKPDIVHVHDMRASVLVFLTGCKVSMVTHVHNNSYESRKLSVKTLLFLAASCKIKHVFWVSNAAFNGYRYHEWFKAKSSILYNAIDVDNLYLKMNSGNYQVIDNYDAIYVGRLEYPKNPKRIVDVIDRCVKQRPNFKMGIVGNGSLEEETRVYINEKKLDYNIAMLGYQSNPYPYLAKAKCMLMTSRWEGLPMCSLEAFALGVPIVSTPTDGLTELIEPEVTGFLYDDDDKLADVLCNIATDEELQHKMSLAAKSKANEILDMKKYKVEICLVYDECVKSRA